jgi:hypothetical protein
LQSIVLTVLQNDKYGIYAQQVAFQDLLEMVGIPWRLADKEGLPEPIFPPSQSIQEEDERQQEEEENV